VAGLRERVVLALRSPRNVSPIKRRQESYEVIVMKVFHFVYTFLYRDVLSVYTQSYLDGSP
jgi:hypothetical protein